MAYTGGGIVDRAAEVARRAWEAAQQEAGSQIFDQLPDATRQRIYSDAAADALKSSLPWIIGAYLLLRRRR